MIHTPYQRWLSRAKFPKGNYSEQDIEEIKKAMRRAYEAGRKAGVIEGEDICRRAITLRKAMEAAR